MKKLMSLILALAMAFTMCVPAFADANDPHPESLPRCTCEGVSGGYIFLIDRKNEGSRYACWMYLKNDGSLDGYGSTIIGSECEPGKVYHESGTLCTTATPAPADPQTTVTMNITKNNTYTLTVPTGVTVANAGFNALDITVNSDNDMESGKMVAVTATSANSWKLKKGDDAVEYKLVANSSATTATTAYTFAAADINATDGKTQAAGVYVTEANYKAANSGTYTDTITFTSEVKAAS